MGSRGTTITFTDEDVEHIREMHGRGMPVYDIAEVLNKSHTVSMVVFRTTLRWKMVHLGLLPKPNMKKAGRPRKSAEIVPQPRTAATGITTKMTPPHTPSELRGRQIPEDIRRETDAIAGIAEILKPLDGATRIRVLRYQYELFGLSWMEGLLPESMGT